MPQTTITIVIDSDMKATKINVDDNIGLSVPDFTYHCAEKILQYAVVKHGDNGMCNCIVESYLSALDDVEEDEREKKVDEKIIENKQLQANLKFIKQLGIAPPPNSNPKQKNKRK